MLLVWGGALSAPVVLVPSLHSQSLAIYSPSSSWCIYISQFYSCCLAHRGLGDARGLQLREMTKVLMAGLMFGSCHADEERCCCPVPDCTLASSRLRKPKTLPLWPVPAGACQKSLCIGRMDMGKAVVSPCAPKPACFCG